MLTEEPMNESTIENDYSEEAPPKSSNERESSPAVTDEELASQSNNVDNYGGRRNGTKNGY